MSEESTKAASSSRSKRFLFMVVVPVLACLAGGAAWLHGGRLVETDNAYVKADLIQISPQVSGNIIHVNVRENQQVKKGDILFEIDAEPYQVAMEKAAANMAQVRTELSALKASYVEKQTELKLAESKLAYAQKEEVRQDNLLKKRYVSDADFDAAHQNVAIARLNVLAVKDDLKQIAESLGGSNTLPAEQHPDYLAAKATLAEALLDYKHTQILAPQDGVVRIPPKTGQYFAAGSQALSMVMNRQMWIEANYTETDLTWVKPGQHVTINVDTYPDHQWHGIVESLSPATSAEFSVLPAQNGTGNWVKIAQRLPVRIRLDVEPDLPLLRAGLSVITEIDTQHQRSVLGLTL